jgi:protein SCO1/2
MAISDDALASLTDRRRLLKQFALGAAYLPLTSAVAKTATTAQTVCSQAQDSRNARYFTNVVVTDQFGEKHRFYADLIKDKIVTFNFFFTSCTKRCPVYTRNLVAVQRLLGARVGREVFMYSFTLDPHRDTPDVLKEYAHRFGVGPGWRFLTGSPADMNLLRKRLGFTTSDPKEDADLSNHLGLCRYGNERLDRWAACPCNSNPHEMVKYISWLDPKWSKFGAPVAPSTNS